MSNRSGFTLMEVLIAGVVSAIIVGGCWAIYVLSNDFYQNTIHELRAQNYARLASEAMLYGLNGDGLLEATAFVVGGGGTTVTYNGRTITYNNVTKQIQYTEGATPLDITPAYVQVNGGIAVTTFNAVISPDNRRVTITFEVTSLRPNANADNYTSDEERASIDLSISARGRMI